MPEKSSKVKYTANEVDSRQSTVEPLDFVVRPRVGNKFYRCTIQDGQHVLHPVLLSTVFSNIDNPDKQSEALELLGIQLNSRSQVKLSLQEFPPGRKKQYILEGLKATEMQHHHQHHQHHQPVQNQEQSRHPQQRRQQQPSRQSDSIEEPCVIELQATFRNQNPVTQPLEIRASYLGDAYVEDGVAFCCLLEAHSDYGESCAVPVPGRGSFSFLAGSKVGPAVTAAQREHCVSEASAGFLQRAALSLTVTLCLCELSTEDENAVVDFYRRVDQAFGYGYGSYLDYLVRCCRGGSEHRISYFKQLCLEFNNRAARERMPPALAHFLENRQPTSQFFEEVAKVMTAKELEKDRKEHFSLKGRAAAASMYFKNASREGLACCPCHVM